MLVRRLATAALTLLLITVIVFGLIHLAPGEFSVGGGGDRVFNIPPEALAEMRAQYRLDLPLHRQYLLWLGDLMRGDLGRSFYDKRPVAEKIGERIGITLAINGMALVLTLVIAVPLGAAAAMRPGSRFDRMTATGTYLLYAVPVFWAALLLQMLFAVELDWLPLAGVRSPGSDEFGFLRRGFDQLRHVILPVTCLTYGGLAYVSRFVRATLLDSAVRESWRAARARGLSDTAVLLRHGLRQAGVPLLTLSGFILPALVGGSVIVEKIFGIPGIGRLFIQAALERDMPVLMGLTLLSGAATLAGILIADMTYAWVDPRIRRG